MTETKLELCPFCKEKSLEKEQMEVDVGVGNVYGPETWHCHNCGSYWNGPYEFVHPPQPKPKEDGRPTIGLENLCEHHVPLALCPNCLWEKIKEFQSCADTQAAKIAELEAKLDKLTSALHYCRGFISVLDHPNAGDVVREIDKHLEDKP